MGIEHVITCWSIRQQSIINEISFLETQLKNRSFWRVQDENTTEISSAELWVQLAKAREKLNALGPNPKPMMG